MQIHATCETLALEGVSCVPPDGRTLFFELNEQFDQRPTGLVGRNGVGKTVLAWMLVGQVRPTAGRCVCSGSVYYLAQQVSPSAGATVQAWPGRSGLGHLDVATPASALSGGEAMRVTLIGALLSNADFLIMDEPSNHLDRANRQALIEQLQRWRRGAAGGCRVCIGAGGCFTNCGES